MYKKILVGLLLNIFAVASSSNVPEIFAITNGRDDVNSAEANAVVALLGSAGRFCTGTLITPTVVVSAGHCDIGRRPGDWETPAAWYPVPNTVEVGFGNDSSGVYANRTRVDPWEIFTLIDTNSGGLMSGDPVNLKSSNGYYLVAEDGGGNFIGASRTVASIWETFVIQKVSGSDTIQSGDAVAFRANNGQYVVAENGGGDVVNANRSVRGPWETFVIEKTGGNGVIRNGDPVALRTNNNHYVVAENGGGGYAYRVRATHYNIPRSADIILLRLASPVAESIAKPMEVLTRAPHLSWTDQRFYLVGWASPQGGLTRRFRQIADGERGEFPCNTGYGRNPQMICPRNGSGSKAAIELGDSGGPLIWRDSATNTKYVIATLQGEEPFGGRYTVAFDAIVDLVNGPHISRWLESFVREDCISFNPDRVGVTKIGDRWKIIATDLNDVLESFTSEGEARQALAIIKSYRFNKKCFVERPDASMVYYLVNDQAPTGAAAGEDCNSFDPAVIQIKQIDRWLTQRYHRPKSFD